MFIKIAIYTILVIVMFKVGLSFGILPQATIFVFALVGLIEFGFPGLVVGIIIGYIFTIILGTISFPFTKFFDIGLFKKKHRRAIAKGFYDKHKQEIMSLDKFKSLNENLIINTFARYINEIHDFTIRLKDPVKKHPHDLNVAEYRQNFVRGGKNWAEHFDNGNEIELMQKYVDFCEIAIYEDAEKYAKK